jgi:hypothetical protein
MGARHARTLDSRRKRSNSIVGMWEDERGWVDILLDTLPDD